MEMNKSLFASPNALAILAMCGALLLLVFGRGKLLAPGDEFAVSITVVPEDSSELDCESSEAFRELRCAYPAGRGSQPDGGAGVVLRPYVSTAGKLIVLSDVFKTPAVAEWLREAQRTHSSQRATLACRARHLGTFTRVGVRFDRNATFEPHQKVLAAKTLACTLEG